MTTFRVHLSSGEKLDVVAEKPTDAARAAEKQRPGTVARKVKLLREPTK